MENKKTFYITTPIYYASGALHLGHCCTTCFADSIARFKRLSGYDVFFLTGADEHGQKVQQKAEEKGVTPQQFVDELAVKVKDLWKLMNISYDKFIRTTDKDHEEAVKKIFTKLYEQGDIYLSEYEGLYCTACESFFTETQAPDNKCPDCHRELHKEKEESYFFKLSNYVDRLKKLFEEHPEFIRLESTKNEMYNSFLKTGLQDLCVSRTTFDWGVKVPFNPKHVIYVWIDALCNYITALGYGTENDELFKKYWPADLHLMAKEIARFHTIYWPIILMALDLPLPKLIHAHGWLTTNNGQKMGKSLGNGFNPYILCDRYGVDAVRYYLLKDGPIMGDAPFTVEGFLTRINSDLCNELGNLLSRTTAMIEQNFGGSIIKCGLKETELSKPLIDKCYSLNAEVEAEINKQDTSSALAKIWQVVRMANKYIDDSMPWTMKGVTEKQEELANILYNLQFALYAVGTELQAFLPDTAKKILLSIGASEITTLDSINKNTYASFLGAKVTKPDSLFPRLKIQDEIKFLTVDSVKGN